MNIKITIAAAAALAALTIAGCAPSTSSTPADTPQQVAHALIGTETQNLITGQDTHDTIMAATPDSAFIPVTGGRKFSCDITLSSGRTLTAEVTVWDNGSVGWHQVTP